MIFEYEALNQQGERLTSVIDAPSESSARQKLRSQGIFVTRLYAADAKTAVSESKYPFKRLIDSTMGYFNQRASMKQVGFFSRQLSTLLRAGMPLLVSISDIIEQIDHRHFLRIIADVKAKLEEGSSFSNALSKHVPVFSDMYVNMVRVGENLGSLDEVLERLAEVEEKKTILRSKIQAALWYPAFLLIVSSAVFFVIMVYIIPTLNRMFIDLGRDLPLITRVVMGVSGFFSSYWMFIFAAAGIAVYFLRKYSLTPVGRTRLDEYKLSFPFYSTLYRKIIVLRFTQNLGILLNHRVDILKSLEIVKKIVMNTLIEKNIDEASTNIKEGMSVSAALSRSGFLPKLVLGMISAGEASDTLDTMLINIGNVYETELDLNISSITRILEPVIIIIMGLIIGIIVISVLLPIFEMNLLAQ